MGFVGAVSPSRLCVSSRAWPVGNRNAARLKSSPPPKAESESTAGQSELEPPSEDLVVRLDLDVLTARRSLDQTRRSLDAHSTLTRRSLALRSFARSTSRPCCRLWRAGRLAPGTPPIISTRYVENRRRRIPDDEICGYFVSRTSLAYPPRILSSFLFLLQVATWGCPPPVSDSESEDASQSAYPLQADFPEVVWGEGKTAEQIAAALEKIASRQGMAAATRVPYQTAVEVQNLLPSCEYNATGQSITLKVSSQRNKLPGTVALITAGGCWTRPASVAFCALTRTLARTLALQVPPISMSWRSVGCCCRPRGVIRSSCPMRV